MNTRQLLSVGIDIGTTTTQVIFSRLELVNRAAVSQVPRYEFIKRDISWQSPVFFTPVDKQGGLKEVELKALILAQYQAAGIAPESVDSGAIIITGESAKTRNARPAVMALSQSLGDFVVASAGPHLESVIAGHGAGAQSLSEQRMCRVLNIDIGGGTTDMAIVHYQLDDGVGANVKITPHLLFREGFKVAGDDLLLDIIQRCVLPSLQTALQRAGVTDAAALLATLFGDSGRIDTQAILRQQTALQLFMPLGHAVLSAWEQSDINDPFAGLHATFGDLLIRRPTSNVMNYIQQAIDHALPSGSPTFDIFNVPLQIQFSQLQESLLAGQFTLTTPLHAVCEAISHYHCDILLVTGRPTCLPGVQALIRHLQPVPVNRIVWMDKYQVHEWYPFSQQGRIGNPKSTAAVGAMLCSLALDLRLPRFNFKAADIGAYSTVRYLGVLDNTVNTLRDENIWYHEIDLDKPGATLDARLHFPLRGNVTLGFRQLANSRWPATPLYCLSINSAELAKTIAGDGVLNVRLKLRGSSKDSAPESFILSDAWLQDGTPVAADALTLKLNTLADRRHSGSHYWIDSGSVYLK
ncbi:virulence effector protein [Salmonella enterica subsp. enterica serovar Typhimurium]|nr:virulence effector protein [Salmonella enterica subsp. enterica serovar Typhimurium]ECY4139414.1 virulence effector protein [Salmonella enterica subsp. enterica serovar Typhimurium]